MGFQIINIKCEECGCETSEMIPTEYGKAAMCTKCMNIIKISDIKKKSLVTCPYCQSTDTKKISGTERVLSIATLGLFSNKINKSFKCNNCKGTF